MTRVPRLTRTCTRKRKICEQDKKIISLAFTVFPCHACHVCSRALHACPLTCPPYLTRVNKKITAPLDKKENCLTPWLAFGYASPAAGVPAVGFGSPVVGGDKPRCSSKAAFLRLGVPGFGRPGREAARPAGAHSGLPTCPVSALPFGSGKRIDRDFRISNAEVLKESERTMSKTTSVDRETASKINPLISNLWTEDTLHSLSGMVLTLGYLLSQVDSPPEGTEPSFGSLWMLCGPIASALEWETDNIRSVIQTRKEKNHV